VQSQPALANDVFLSYRHEDRDVVSDLDDRLGRRGVRTWRDEQALRAGDEWIRHISGALRQSRACAVLIGKGGLGGTRDQEIQLAMRLHEEQALRVFVVLLPGCDLKRLQSNDLFAFLGNFHLINLQAGLDDEINFKRLVNDIAGEPSEGDEQVLGPCPYVDLKAFTFADRLRFFGRETETSRIVERLIREPLVAVLGASGSGKSSLVQAGVIPAYLQRFPGAPFIRFRPGPQPFQAAALAINALRGRPTTPGEVDALAADPRALSLLASGLGGAAEESPSLVVVDQFEELFTECRDISERAAFVDSLVVATSAAALRIVLTLRVDFYDHVADHRDLATLVAEHTFLLGPLSSEGVRAAIERPARVVGLEPQSGLVDVMLGDLDDQPGMLPLFQHALYATWEHRVGPMLTVAGYLQGGGVTRALARHANSVFAELSPDERLEAERILLLLVRPGVSGNRPTSRRGSLSDLTADTRDPAMVASVAQRLVRERLLTAASDPGGEQTLEVVHEALIRHWPMLRRLVEECGTDLAIRDQWAGAAEEWARSRDAGLLYRAGRLDRARDLATRHGDWISKAMHSFLEASTVAVVAEQRREASGRRLRRVVPAIVAATVVLALLAGFAWVGWGRASRASTENKALQLASEAAGLFQTQLDAGLVRALVAESTASNVTTRRTLLAGLTAGPGPRSYQALPGRLSKASLSESGSVAIRLADTGEPALVPPGGQQQPLGGIADAVALSTKGDRVAVGRPDGFVDIRCSTAHCPSPSARKCRTGDSPDLISWSQDGTKLVVAGGSGSRFLRVIAPSTCDTVQIDTGMPSVTSVALDANGGRAVAGSTSGVVRLWEVPSGRQLTEQAVGHGRIGALAFRQEVGVVDRLFGAAETTVWSMDLPTLRFVQVGEASDVVTALAVASDGVVAGAFNGSLRRWVPEGAAWRSVATASSGQSQGPVATNNARLQGEDSILAVAANGGSSQVRSVDGRGRLIAWALTNLSPIASPSVSDATSVDAMVRTDAGRTLVALGAAGVSFVDVRSGGTTFAPLAGGQALAGSPTTSETAVGLADGQVLLSTQQGFVPVGNHPSGVTALSFDSSGRLLASGGGDGLLITDLATGSAKGRLTLPTDRGSVRAVAIDKAGTRVVAGTDGGWVVIWRLADLTVEREMKVSMSDVFTIAFAPDGRRLAFGGDARTIWVWNLQGADPCGADSAGADKGALCLRGHTDRVRSVAWDRNGGRLISGGEDATALMWDLAAPGSPQYSLRVGSQVNAVGFDPYGSDEVTLAGTGVATWRLDVASWRTEACRIVAGTSSAAAEPRLSAICRAGR
jgi:WD40 repeat protein